MSSIRPDEHPSFLDAYTIDSEEDGWEGFQGEDLSDLLAEVDRDLDSLAEKGDLDGGGRRRSRSAPEIPPADRVDIFDPAHNMREVNKQLLLLEDHLFHPPKYCPDCIRKHLMKSEAFADEAHSLDRKGEFASTLSWLPHKLRLLQDDFLVGLDKNSLAQRARTVRKQLSKETFGALKMRAKARYGQEAEVLDEPGARPPREVDLSSTSIRDVQFRMETEEEERVSAGECPTPLPSRFLTNNLPTFWKYTDDVDNEYHVYPAPQSGIALTPGLKVWMPTDEEGVIRHMIEGTIGDLGGEVAGIPVRCIPTGGEDEEAWGENRARPTLSFRGSRRAINQYVPVLFRGEQGEHGNSWARWRSTHSLIPVSPFQIVEKYFSGRSIPMFLANGTHVDVVLNAKQLNGLKAIEGAFYARLWLAGPYKPEEIQISDRAGQDSPYNRPGGFATALEKTEIGEAVYPPSERPWLDGSVGLKNVNVDGFLSQLRKENPGVRFLPFSQERRLQLWYRVVMSFLVQALYVDSSGVMGTLRSGCGGYPSETALKSPGDWANTKSYEFLAATGLHPDQTFSHPYESPRRPFRSDGYLNSWDRLGQIRNLLTRSFGENAIGQAKDGTSRHSPAWGPAPAASEWAMTWAYTIGDPLSIVFTGDELSPGIPEAEQSACSIGDMDLAGLPQQTALAVCQTDKCTPDGELAPPAPTSTRDSSLPTLVGYAFDPSEQAAFETRMSSNAKVANTIREAKAKEQQAMGSQRGTDEAGFRLWTTKAAEDWERASTESGELWPLVRAIGMYDTLGDVPTSYRARGDLIRRFPGTHWANIAAAERAAMESNHSRFFLRSASEKGQSRKVLVAGIGMGALLFGGLYLKGGKLPGGEKR